MKKDKIMKKIERQKIKNVDNLLLWHNNPRLIEEFGEERSMDVIESCQEEIKDRLIAEGSIHDLVKSILSNGWLGYDPILVATIENGKKFVVLEGNRRVTALKTITERANKGLLTKQDDIEYDEEDIDAQIKKEGIEVFNAGDFSSFPEDREKLVKKILNIRHIISQNPWPLHRKAFQVFKDYMEMLAAQDSSVLNTIPKSFYLENKIVTVLSHNMGEKEKEIRNYLYIHRLRTQLDEALIGLGSEFPKDKTSYIEEFLSKPDLRRRYGFDPENGTISSGEYTERFCKTFFDYPGNKAPVRQASAGDASLRDYAFVVKKDPTDNEEFITMIEERQMSPSEIKSRVVHRLGDFALEDGLEDILNMIEKIKLGDFKPKYFDSDRTREVVETILNRFSYVEKAYEDWKDEN